MIDHEKMVQDFIASQTANWLEEDLKLIAGEFPVHRENLTLSLAASINELCCQAGRMQAAGQKGAGAYLWISLLRTNILDNNWQYRLDLYDERFLFDDDECAVYWEMDFVFGLLRDRLDKLVQAARKGIYATKMHQRHLDELKLKMAVNYHQAAINIVSDIIRDAIKTDAYISLVKAPFLHIVMGEYFDQFTLLYESQTLNSG